MRIGVSFPKEKISKLFDVLDFSDERTLDDILVDMLNFGINSSDLLFVSLQKLEEMGIARGSAGKIVFDQPLTNEAKTELEKHLEVFLERNSNKLFVTPLEVAKYYQCPRRLFLEKVVLSRQEKESEGRTWDGEVIHKSTYLMIKNIMRENIVEELPNLIKTVFKEYRGRYTITLEEVEDFLLTFLDFIKKNKFRFLFPETTIVSFKMGIMGTPDLIAISNKGDIVPIDLKLGGVRSKLKEEHVLQNVGEGLLAESFFRKNIDKCYLVYYSSRDIADIKLTRRLKERFLDYKTQIVRMIRSGRIPPMSNLPNFRKRVCPGCHVRKVCDHIEKLRAAVAKQRKRK